MATAPPFTFTFSGLRRNWRVTAMAATAKASLSSTRSKSLSRSQPVLMRSFSTASTGAIMTHLGSTPLTAWATMRASGFLPSDWAWRSLVTINAAAPSFVPGALPAVTCLSFLNAGFYLRDFDRKDWRFKEAGFARAHGFLVTFKGEAILLFAGDAVFFSDEFAGHAHVEVFVGVPQAVVNHGVDEFAVADAIAGASLRK